MEEDKKRIGNIYSKPFDFYGMQIRLNQPEKENIVKDNIVKYKDLQIF